MNGERDLIKPEDIDTFASVIPTEMEILQFKERLSDYSVDSFLSLELLQKPYQIARLEQPEKFMVNILKDESLIIKAMMM